MNGLEKLEAQPSLDFLQTKKATFDVDKTRLFHSLTPTEKKKEDDEDRASKRYILFKKKICSTAAPIEKIASDSAH